MAEIKTKPTRVHAADFFNEIEDERKRHDCHELAAMMAEITGKPAVMWGKIVGFGKYHYKYEGGREGEMLMTGFSPRSQNLTLYLGPGIQNKALLTKLGKHKTGKGCLYIRNLDDVDRRALRELIRKCVKAMRERHDCE
jgi:hypothetical protein